MKIYCLIKNGELVEGPISLPLFFENISNFNYLSEEELKVFGWLPVSMKNTPGCVFVENKITIHENVVEYLTVNRERTEEELKRVAAENLKEAWVAFRQKRDNLLKATDVYMLLDNWNKLSADAQEKLTAYRQSLRDLPSTVVEPGNFIFPVFNM